MAKLSSTSVYGNLYVDGEIVNDALDAELGQSIKSLSVNGKTITYTKNNGTTGTIITQDTNTTYGNATTSTSGLMSSADKTKLDGIATNANNYSHPTTSGNKHIPAGGSSGQILRWASDGTAAWGNDNNTTYSTGTASTAGLTKLYTGTGTATDGTMTQSAINTALNGKANSSHTHNSITNQDTRNVNTTPTQMPLGLSVHLKSNSTDGLNDGGTYHSTLMIKGWNDVSGGPWAQMAVTANNNLYFRSSNNDTWNAWKKVSLDGHTHNYAGSSSAGGAANSAIKLATARSINGTNFDGTGNITTANWGTARNIYIADNSATNTGPAVSVNGSANATLKLPATIKASLTGNASTATTLATARTINDVSFNGSANITIPLKSFTSAIGNDNTNNYHRILSSGTVTGTFQDRTIILMGSGNYSGGPFGIFKVILRTNGTDATSSCAIEWIVRKGFSLDSIVYNMINTNGSTVADIFYKGVGTYASINWTVLFENSSRGGSYNNSAWTKYTTNASGTEVYTETTMKAIRSYTSTLVKGSDVTTVNSAHSLATARTINGTSFNGSANITTANWGTARNIYIADNSSTNTGPAVSVNGSGNATLKLPATIKATLTGNASTATTLQTTRTINGTSFNGSADITTANWGTARTITIGATGKSVNGSGNYSWSASEILAGQTVGYGNFGGLFIERTGSTNGASIGFKNSNGTLGYIGMNAVNGGLMRWSADTNSQYTVLDTGNYKTHITPANIGAAISSHTHYYAGSSSVGGAANSAVKATQDSAGQQINTTYIKGLSVSGRTITYTKGDGTTGTITTQDTNTTYSTGTASALGLTKLYTGTGTATDGTMTQAALKTALDDKAASSHTHSYLPLSGGTITGELSCNRYLNINAWSGYGTGAAKIWYDATTTSNRALKMNNVDNITLTKGTVYHPGNKPTPADIGAAPALALANSYYGMVTNDGNSSNWIRTTLNGIIPYQSNSSGSSSLGTSGWPFSTVYATNFYGTLNGNATHWGGRQVWWGAAGSRPGNGYIQFVW